MFFRAEFCFCKPRGWKFFSTIRHVLAAEYAKLQHFFWREFRGKYGIELFTDRRGAEISVPFLHFIVNGDNSRVHVVKDSGIRKGLQQLAALFSYEKIILFGYDKIGFLLETDLDDHAGVLRSTSLLEVSCGRCRTLGPYESLFSQLP